MFELPTGTPSNRALMLPSALLRRAPPTLFKWAVVVALSTACASQASDRRRLLDQAQDLNTASRFGRLDVASQLAAPAAQGTFLERRSQWGAEIRVLDTQISHLQVTDDETAEVTVQVDWTRMNEGLLRSTWVLQKWAANARGPWRLESETQVQGDTGLFGEQVPEKTLAPAQNHFFPTRSLGTTP